jgi:cystathionine beta-lyase/cystathionine gamma-synthase
MVKRFPSRTHIGNHMLHPETLMLNYGYDPQLSEGAVKPPVFLTSTFVFRTAEDGQDFFDFVSGRRKPPCSGHGAKFAPAIGEKLARLAIDPAYEVEPFFRLSRYSHFA